MEVDAAPGRHPYPWQGKNAYDLLMEDYNRITSLFPNNNDATENDNWHSTYSIYDVDIQNKEFYPAHKASAKMNIYFADDFTVDLLLLKITHLVKNVSIKKITGSERVYLNHREDKVLQLQKIMQKNFDKEIIVRTENGSSDARYFTNKGIPIVIMKVVGEDFHGDNEHLEIPYLMPLYNSLSEFILSNVSSNVSKSNEAITNEV
jgi:succinyl-diaminopimelate desuccinylase